MVSFFSINFSVQRLFRFLVIFLSLLFLEGCTNIGHTPENLHKLIEKNWPLSSPGNVTLASQKDVKIGIKYLKNKNYEQASKSFNTAIRLNPQNSLFHYLNALTYHLWGVETDPSLLRSAEVGYKTSLALDSGNSLSSYNLGQLYMHSNNYKKAQNNFANALLTSPYNSIYLLSLAISSYLCQDVETALEAIIALEKQEFFNEDVYKAATLIYGAANNFKKAQENLDKFAQIGSPSVKKELPHLQKRLIFWKNFYATTHLEIEKKPISIHEEPLGKCVKKSLISSKSTSKKKSSKDDFSDDFSSSSRKKSSKDDSSDDFSSSSRKKSSKDDSSDDSSSSSHLRESLSSQRDDESEDGDYTSPKSQQMVVLNVMILSIAKLTTQTYGQNLLDVLNITAGGLNTITGINTPALGTSHDNSRTPANVRTNYISLGSLVYSLNIANNTSNHNELIANPSLIATHGQPSNFFSGTDYTLALTSTQGGGNLVSKEVGISLSLTPFFLNNGKIVLKVSALRTVVSNNPLPGNLAAASNATPTFQTDKSTVTATSILAPGESLVLSGLTERFNIKGRSEVPILGDVPVASFFFSNDNTQVLERSILFIISPEFSEKIIKDSAGNWIVVPEEHEEKKSSYLDYLKKSDPKTYHLPANVLFLKKLSEPQYSRNFRATDMPLKTSIAPSLEFLLTDIQEITPGFNVENF